MKKLITFIVLVLTALVLVSCGPEGEPIPELGNTTNIAFHKRTDEVIQVPLSMSRRIFNVSLPGGGEDNRWYIGQSPEIYFEYSRDREFTFVEAGIERSSKPGVVFKFSGSTTNLDGYKIVSGQTWDGEEDRFRAIITIPTIQNYGEDEFVLVSIKIKIDGYDVDIAIPKEVEEFKIASFEEDHWALLDEEAAERGVGADAYTVFPFGGTSKLEGAEHKFTRDGIELESHQAITEVGDRDYTFLQTITYRGVTKSYEYVLNFVDNWELHYGDYDYTGLVPKYRFGVLKLLNETLTIELGQYYDGRDVVINRNLGGLPVAAINVQRVFGIELPVNVMLKGYTLEEAQAVFANTSYDFPINVKLNGLPDVVFTV